MNANGIGVNVTESKTRKVESQECYPKWMTPGLIACIAIASLTLLFSSLAGAASLRVWRTKHYVRSLEQLDANFAWQHQTVDRQLGEQPNRVQRALASWLGSYLVSNISRVSISKGNPSDAELKVVSELHELRSMDLVSDAATDATIAALSELPKLRYLTLVGRNFSVRGLLQLRNARTLRELRIETHHFSATELALLRAELPIESDVERMEFRYDEAPEAMVAPMI